MRSLYLRFELVKFCLLRVGFFSQALDLMVEEPLLGHFTSGHRFLHLIDFQYFGFDSQHLDSFHFFGLWSLVTYVQVYELIPELLDLRIVA